MRINQTIRIFGSIQLNDIVAVVFIMLFSYVGVSKLIDFQQFRNTLAMSPILGFAPSVAAFLIPSTELIVAGLLVTTRFRRSAMAMTIVLMVAFTYYVAQILSRNWGTPCTCGGVISALSWRQHLYLNIFLSLLAVLGILFPLKSNRTKDIRSGALLGH